MRLVSRLRPATLVAGTLLLILAVNVSFYAAGKLNSQTDAVIRTQPLLRIAVWEDHIAPENIESFIRDHNCRVEVTTFSSNDELIERITLDSFRFDVIFPSSYVIPRLNSMRVLARVDRSRLRHASTIDARIDTVASVDPVNEAVLCQFGVPFVVAPTGIAASRGAGIPESDLATWTVFDRRELIQGDKKRATLLHDMRETFAAALLVNRHSVNATDDKALSDATMTIRRWLRVAQFNDDSYAEQLTSGTIDVAHAYPGDVGYIRGGDRKIDFFLPREGSSISIQYMCIVRGSPQESLAYEFIDSMLAPSNAMKNIAWSHIRCASDSVWEQYKLGPRPSNWQNAVPYQLDTIPAEMVLQPLMEEVYRKYDLLWRTVTEMPPGKEQP